jgi:hypothetical protein
VEDLECLDIYPYAGHSVVMGKRKNDWQEVDYVLAYFGKGLSISRKNYRSYVQEGIVQGKRKDLTGGGVVRSMGGWKEVKTSLTRGDRVKGDERILGDSDFVLGALKASEEKFERTFQIKKRGIDLEKLSKRVGMIFKVEPEKILSPGKYKNVVDARSVLCYWAVREIEISATDLAKRLKLSQPAVSIAVKRGNKIVREKGLILPID